MVEALLVLAFLSVLPLSALAADTESGSPLDRRDMDLTVRPGDDFFRYANGGWLDRTEIPDDHSSYRLKDIMYERRNRAMEELIDEVSALTSAPEGSAAQKIRDLLNTGMDYRKSDAEGIAPLHEEFRRIRQIETVSDVQDVVAYLHSIFLNPIFRAMVQQDLRESETYVFHLLQSGTGLPDIEYYLGDDGRSKEIRGEYLEHLIRLFKLLGDDPEMAASSARAVMKIETRLAEKSMTRLEMRNPAALYNKMDLDGLKELAPGFDWERYFKNIHDEPIDQVIVGMPEFFREVDRLMEETNVAEWKAYLRANVINGFAEFLNSEFAMEDHRFYGEFLSGKKKMRIRKARVVETITDGLGELIGQLYVERNFSPEAKTRVLDLVANLRKALEIRIRNLEWMSDSTKEEALAKLGAMRVKIGYPDKWKDYSGLEIRDDSYILNLKRITRFLYQQNLSRLGNKVDPEEWIIPPQLPNAGYVPQRNEIIFPAGFLQPPLFDPSAEDAVIYGSIGMGIAHEMIHGFDDQGRKFDRDGNLRDWWTEADTAAFEERTRLLVDQYGALVAVDDVHVDGRLTLGENIADFGGLTVAFDAYRMSLGGKTPPVIDGFTHEQRFFLAFAQFFRGKIREPALRRMVVEDKHPWGRFRVNGAPFNIPEFYQVFDIRPGDRLYRSEEERPKIW